MLAFYARSHGGRLIFTPSLGIFGLVPGNSYPAGAAEPPVPPPRAEDPGPVIGEAPKPFIRPADPISPGIGFATGVNITITMNNDSVFTGEIVQEVGGYLWLKLTAATPNYAAGIVVHLNENLIVAVG